MTFGVPLFVQQRLDSRISNLGVYPVQQGRMDLKKFRQRETNVRKLAPAMTPAVLFPSDNPSVPCAVILVPVTLMMCNLIHPLISKTLSHRTSSNNSLLPEILL